VGQVDHVTLFCQASLQDVAETDIIFNDEYSHARMLARDAVCTLSRSFVSRSSKHPAVPAA